MQKRLMVALASVILGLGLATGPVSADHPESKLPADCQSGRFTSLGQCVPFVNPGVQVYLYDLHPVPHDPQRDGGSNARGTGVITVVGHLVIVEISVQGMSPGLVHVQHIHGVGANRCPGPEARNVRVADGLIDTVEGLPDYGPIVVSLTTSGDTSAASGLAVDRFPVAGPDGTVTYRRTFIIGQDFPASVARNLAQHHIVSHGIDVNRNGAYDAGAGFSALAPNLPLEAELPAVCGLTGHGRGHGHGQEHGHSHGR